MILLYTVHIFSNLNVKTKNKTAIARYTIQWTKLSANFRTPTLQTTLSSEDPQNNGTKDPKNNGTNSSTQHSPHQTPMMKNAYSSRITYRSKETARLTRQYYPEL